MDVVEYMDGHGNAVFSHLAAQTYLRTARLAICPKLLRTDDSGDTLHHVIGERVWLEPEPSAGCIVYASSTLQEPFVKAVAAEQHVKLLVPDATTGELADAVHDLTEGRIALQSAWEAGPLRKHADLLFVAWSRAEYRLAYEFDASRTVDEPFRRHGLPDVSVPMMCMRTKLDVGAFRVLQNAAPGDDAASTETTFGVVSLLTACKTRRLVFLLPNISEGKKTMSTSDLALYGEGSDVWALAVRGLNEEYIELKLPRFALQTSILVGEKSTVDGPVDQHKLVLSVAGQLMQGSTFAYAVDGASDGLRVKVITSAFFGLSGEGDCSPPPCEHANIEITFDRGFCFACMDLKGNVLVNGVVSDPSTP